MNQMEARANILVRLGLALIRRRSRINCTSEGIIGFYFFKRLNGNPVQDHAE